MPLDRRRLHLKIRVVTTRPMSATTARLLFERAAMTGIVPPGIELHGIDWSKGRLSDRIRGGRPIRRALRDFLAALVHSGTSTRFALVSGGERAPTPAPKRAPKRGGPFKDQAGRYRNAKGQFISKREYDAQRRRFTAEEEDILDDMRTRLRRHDVGARAEFEFTATTRGGTPKQR